MVPATRGGHASALSPCSIISKLWLSVKMVGAAMRVLKNYVCENIH